MSAFYVAATVVAAYGVYSQNQAARDARRSANQSADEEARLEGILTDEKIRQMGQEREQTLGIQRSGYAGSGVEVGSSQLRPGEQIASGSVMDVLTETSEEYAKQISATRETGASRAANIITRGNMIGDNYVNQAQANAWSSAGNIFMMWAARG